MTSTSPARPWKFRAHSRTSLQWLEEHFPFIPPSRIVFCGDKNIINADVLIDDRSRHFKDFRGTGILFTAPHNVARNRAFTRKQLE